MSNIIELTKVLMKNNLFSFSGKKKTAKQSGNRGGILGFFVLFAFFIAVIGGPIIFVLSDILKIYDFSELILSFSVPVGGLTSILFGVFSIISVFYFSKDSEQLLHLPIKSSELLIAKFLTSLASTYLILAMFIFPIIFGVGLGINASFVYYLYSIGICLLMPIIPMVLVSIIIMISNKLFKFGKRKDIFMYIMTGFILIFSFAYSFGLTYLMEIEGEDQVLALLSGDFSNLIKISKWIFPFFNSAASALLHYDEFIGFASFMTFIGFNLLSAVILYFVGDKLYVKGLTDDNGNNKNKKHSIEDTYKPQKGGVMKALLKKEWLVIKRSPIFMLNVIIINLIYPIIFGISFVIAFNSEGVNIEMISQYINFNNSGILLIVIGALLLLCSMACSTSSSISRDGSSAAVMKTIPVSYKKQMDAKVLFSMIIDLSILVLIEVPLTIVFRVPWYYLILVNIPLVIIMLIVSYLSLLLDLKRPKLDWKEESEAVKQNLNVFFSLVFTMVVCAAFVMGGVFLLSKNVNIYLMFALISVVLLLGYVCLNLFVSKKQVKLFEKVG